MQQPSEETRTQATLPLLAGRTRRDAETHDGQSERLLGVAQRSQIDSGK